MTEYPTRPGTTTITKYNCGHAFVNTTAEPMIFDPAGMLAENQKRIESNELCGKCAKEL